MTIPILFLVVLILLPVLISRILQWKNFDIFCFKNIFPLFYFLFIVPPAIIYKMTQPPSVEFTKTIWLYILGIIGFWSGCFFYSIIGSKVQPQKNIFKESTLFIKNLRIVAILFLIIGWIFCIIQMYRLGFTKQLLSRGEFFLSSRQIKFHLPWESCISIATIIFFATSYTLKLSWFNFLNLFVYISFFLFIILELFIIGERGVILEFILGILIVYHYLKKPIKISYMVYFVSIFFFVFIFVSIYRSIPPEIRINSIEGLNLAIQNFNINKLLFLSFNALGSPLKSTIKIIEYRWHFFSYGKTYIINALPCLIPSWLYSDVKPLPLSHLYMIDFFPSLHYSGAGSGFSPIAEAFINFGLFGPFAIFFLLSLLFSYLYKRRTMYYYFFIYSILIMILHVFLRNDFGIALSKFFNYFIVLSFTCFFTWISYIIMCRSRGKDQGH